MSGNKKYTCLACKQPLKRSVCVPCHVCEEYTHPECSNISKDLLKYLIEETREGNSLSWTCDHCKKVGVIFDKKIKQLNKDLTQLRKDVTDNKTSQDALAEEVKIVKEKSKKNEDMIAKNVETTQQTIFSEIREREEKKCNLIIHNLLESSEAGSGLDRKQYDIDCIMEIMEEISVTFGKDDIKFIRRLGEKTDDGKIRPVQLGVKAITMKENILSHAKRLKDSADYYEVNIVPDLTKQQRKEEDDLSKEVTKRNLELDPEVSLNSEWKLVGPKGQKRMILVKKQDGQGARGGPRGRSRGRGSRGTSQKTHMERSVSMKRARTPEKTIREKRMRGVRGEEMNNRTETEEEEEDQVETDKE